MVVVAFGVQAADKTHRSKVNSLPKIIIVLDDVGYKKSDAAAFDLPVEVAFSILPQTPYANEYANRANAQGRDVMLHLPMSSQRKRALGPAALKVGMYDQDIEQVLIDALDSVPHVIGVNNHMGSALTEQYAPMRTLMSALKSRSLFFLDSRTSPHSVAFETARDIGLATDKRHIFIDHIQTEAFYEQQVHRLIRIAKKYGRAIGIAHPYPSSLRYLSHALNDIERQGVTLQHVSDYFDSRFPRERKSYKSTELVAAPSE
ncbi:divergent polysaccharide deacetylase family protein [Alteromonas sediminis]|uniref:Divergent polysaccharide deacetylase family protein n=1 Tax=Alteromonas sediminis TaxID=2259342 RepID=A0A3N5XZ77_9ALTE|nr:divergent polysaccharide deacetylase family protein [Alteromonas sediminis]RPJ66342.1 divergent polysaccharide deacetylase family protein [Alteromonas sediminis]